MTSTITTITWEKKDLGTTHKERAERLTVVIALTIAKNTAAMAEMIASIPRPIAENIEP